MLSEEILKKVRQIEITTRRMVTDMMSGQYRSHFKGHGVQFSEHRVYVAGDDVRHIDWKVSARTRDPLIKKFEEERQLTVFLVVDVSQSKSFGTTRKLKSEVAAEIAGMLAYAAIHSGDRVGVLLFAGEVELIIPPKKGRTHIQRIIRDVLAHQSRSQGTDLAAALDSAGRVMKHSGVIFVISDFIAQNYELNLKRVAQRHDVVAIQVQDEREKNISQIGNELGALWVENPETGHVQVVHPGSYHFKKWFEEFEEKMKKQTGDALRSGKVEHLQILTQEDYGSALVKFFNVRARKRR